LAGAHAVLVILYHLLRDHKPYNDLGVDSFDRLILRGSSAALSSASNSSATPSPSLLLRRLDGTIDYFLGTLSATTGVGKRDGGQLLGLRASHGWPAAPRCWRLLARERASFARVLRRSASAASGVARFWTLQ
jgi:hypothetical protein